MNTQLYPCLHSDASRLFSCVFLTPPFPNSTLYSTDLQSHVQTQCGEDEGEKILMKNYWLCLPKHKHKQRHKGSMTVTSKSFKGWISVTSFRMGLQARCSSSEPDRGDKPASIKTHCYFWLWNVLLWRSHLSFKRFQHSLLHPLCRIRQLDVTIVSIKNNWWKEKQGCETLSLSSDHTMFCVFCGTVLD